MSLWCRIGWHAWSDWRPFPTTSTTSWWRDEHRICMRCGNGQNRRVAIVSRPNA